MSTIIAGMMFIRCGPNDEWVSVDGRLQLRLDMQVPKYPWRTAVDGKWLRGNWSTPYVAVMRTAHRLRQ